MQNGDLTEKRISESKDVSVEMIQSKKKRQNRKKKKALRDNNRRSKTLMSLESQKEGRKSTAHKNYLKK